MKAILTLALSLVCVLTLATPSRAVDPVAARQFIGSAEDKLRDAQKQLDVQDVVILRLGSTINDRDKALDQLKADQARELAKRDADHADAVRKLNGAHAAEGAKLRQQIADRDNAQNKALGLMGQVIGGVVVLLGALLLAFRQPEGGIKLLAVGIGLVCLSQAFARWGWLFSVAGAVLAAGILIYEVVATRNDAKEIADGQKQTENAGIIPQAVRATYDAIKDQATGSRAKRIVKQVTT